MPIADNFQCHSARIQSFYRHQLKSPLVARWSWGAYNAEMHRVVFTLWMSDFRRLPNGEDALVILWTESTAKSHGLQERKRQIALIQDNGAEPFAILAQAKSGGGLKAFDSQLMVRLGRPMPSPGNRPEILAPIKEIITVSQFLGGPAPLDDGEAETDIRDVQRDNSISATTKEALIQARRGQGQFRERVLAQSGRRCAVTGCAVTEAIRASHIKPWRESNNSERLNPNNGIALVATLDALFDRYLISFDDSGEMIVSPTISVREQKILGLRGRLNLSVTKERREFLRQHRRNLITDPV